MTEHQLTVIALALSLVTLQAQQKAPELPLPAALKVARSAYLVNGGVVDRVMEWTIRDLRKWDRFELVGDSEASDITITITATPANPYGSYRLIMTITSTATKVPLYTVSVRCYRLLVLRLMLSLSCLNFLVPGPSPPGL